VCFLNPAQGRPEHGIVSDLPFIHPARDQCHHPGRRLQASSSDQQRLDDSRFLLTGQLHVQTLILIRQPLMIKSELVENGRLEVPDVNRDPALCCS
jgi:hypothetical protein